MILPFKFIPIICDFLDVSPQGLPWLPPNRKIKFTIDLELGMRAIFKSPYRMAPKELGELQDEIIELLDNEFIKPRNSPLGASVVFFKKKDNSLRLFIDYES